MSTNSLQSLHHHHHHHHSFLKRHLLDTPPSSLFLKPTTTTTTNTTTNTTTTISLSHTLSTSFTTFSTTSTTPSTSQAISFDLLQNHLSNKNFKQADEETRRLLIVLAGEPAQKRGYVFFSEVQFIPQQDLKTIDELWKQHSNNKFGYSVQKKIYDKADRDFSKFFRKVGWVKKLDTEIEQYNYRAFPTEFIWELNDDTPEGHLPLTNALRGTQLLNSILTHPAFGNMEEEEDKEQVVVEESSSNNGGLKGLRDGSEPLSNRVFIPDYSF